MTRKEKLLNMIETDPKDPFLRFGLAMEYAKEGDYAHALEQFDHALHLDPHYCVAYYHKAKTLAVTGDIPMARQVISDGLRAAQTAHDAHTERELTELLESLSLQN